MKIRDHDHNKYITTQEFNTLTADNFAVRLAQTKLATKDDEEADLDNKVKNINEKATSNKTKHVLVENELDELSEEVELISTKELTKDLINEYSILKGAKKFYLGALQNYLVFISANKYNEFYSDTEQICSSKSEGMSEESIKNTSESSNTFAPSLIYYRPLGHATFAGNCLRLNSISL